MTASNNIDGKIWGVMPAAGIGSRMRSSLPKQYHQLAGKTVIEHSIELLLNIDDLAGLVVCVAEDDQRFGELPIQSERVIQTLGGETRAHSVLNGLQKLSGLANADDWVMVHDAARPCLAVELLYAFIEEARKETVGGIMAIKCSDTLKQAVKSDQGHHIAHTIDRSTIWQAQTPQMIRYSVLLESLSHCLANQIEITDEASALEYAGHSVKLIEGSSQNFKITTNEDKKLAELLLTQG